VVGDGWLALSEGSFEIARTDFYLGCDKRDQTQANRIGKRRKDLAELRRLCFVDRGIYK
jgi:hypothetical protein